MITAVGSSVLLDVLAGPPEAAERAAGRLGLCAMEDRLIVCETVIAEVTPEADAERMEEFLRDWHLKFVALSAASAVLAGPCTRIICGGAGSADGWCRISSSAPMPSSTQIVCSRGMRVLRGITLSISSPSRRRPRRANARRMKARIRQLLHAAPFQPFIIRIPDGKKYRIEHPDFVLAASSDVPQIGGRSGASGIARGNIFRQIPHV